MRKVDQNDSVSTLMFAAIAAMPLAGALFGPPPVAAACALAAAVYLTTERLGPGMDRSYVWIRRFTVLFSWLVVLAALGRLSIWAASQPNLVMLAAAVVVVVTVVASIIYHIGTRLKIVDLLDRHEECDVT